MMKELLMKLIVLLMLMSVFAYAGTYDYSYSPLGKAEESNSTADAFMYGDFEKIIRFKALLFEGGTLSADSKEYLGTIAKTVGEFKNSGQSVAVSIIGHTQASTDDPNEKAIKSHTYAEKVISWFSRELSQNTSEGISEGYAKDVQKLLVEQGVDKNLTRLEYRGGQDEAFSDATSEGRDLSNRVMVTLYLFAPEEIDSDGDSVLDKSDACPKTPKGVAVNTKGCPFDMDGDGVYDYLDQCPGTLKGVKVNNMGCPLDSDDDGVYDFKDKCPNTPQSFKVDSIGCPLSKKLILTFASRSYDIQKESYAEVLAFAKFLKDNPQYNAEIVGHTDSVGKKAFNMTLSEGRANAVKEALVREGIALSRLKSRGRGELDPIADNRSSEGRQMNRRIEVKLYY